MDLALEAESNVATSAIHTMHAYLIVGACLESRRVRLREFITPLAEFSS
jgi:hypothetical protein